MERTDTGRTGLCAGCCTEHENCCSLEGHVPVVLDDEKVTQDAYEHSGKDRKHQARCLVARVSVDEAAPWMLELAELVLDMHDNCAGIVLDDDVRHRLDCMVTDIEQVAS